MSLRDQDYEPSWFRDLPRSGRMALSAVRKNLVYFVLGLYVISAVYILVKLPEGIILSTDISSPSAVTAPTYLYLLVLNVFLVGFMHPFIKRGLYFNLSALLGSAVLLLFHWLFVSANL